MNLKIYKLRSGEEIICQVLEEGKTKIKVSKPLIFISSTSFDNKGSYDMTVLRDWLQHTEIKSTSIPKNHIVTEIIPNDDTVKLYELQLESDKSIKEKIIGMNKESLNLNQHDIEDSEKVMHDFLSAMLNDIASEVPPFDMPPSTSKRKSSKTKKQNMMPSPEMDENELDKHGIYLTMMIPSEAIMNLISAGILNPKDLLKMIKEVKKRNRFTGDETDRGDFGNKFSDWNPDPDSNDYK